MRLVDLKAGEHVRLWRRRQGWTREETAKRLSTTADVIGMIELGYRSWDSVSRTKPDLPWVGCEEIEPHEACFVYRLRTGVSQTEIAATLGCSRVWVNQMERGKVDCTALTSYWEA